ncbi:methyltransferase domain-containing protein [Pseudonocardia sp. CA-107938]|uniref:methyltransferase domain-containing protein n=1 Tax=Pseudonocardia sp. CA-107938 TaxID=3240021 RepID=UPI003D92780F
MTAANDYDSFARSYAAHNESKAFNAGYERPAVLAMVGDVAGKHVLDAGCGAGAHAAELVARGARVVGVDASAGMLEVAAERLGPEVPLHRADLADPLPWVRFWHRPLRAMIDALAEAGLRLSTLDEPAPQPYVEQSDPRAWRLLTTAPRFLFVVAEV